MDIGTAALVRYDLCHRSERDQLLNDLQAAYGVEGKEYGEQVLGGPRWDRYKFEGDLSSLDADFKEFEKTTTYISFETRHLIDVVTVAELSSRQIEEIEENDPNRTQYFIGELSERLSKIAGEIPTVSPIDFNKQSVHLYIEPVEPQPVTDSDGDIDPELLANFLEDSRGDLEKYYYLVDHPQSLLGTEDLVAPHASPHPWGRLTVVNISSPPAGSAEFEPVWLRRLKPLREYLRTYLWFRHRRQLLASLDRETHGIDQLMRNASGGDGQLGEVLQIERELDDIRETWTDRYTKTVDEVADLEVRPPLRNHPSHRREKLTISEITDGAPVNSLLDIYDQQLATQTEQVTSDLNRIGNKLDEVSSYIHDKINVRATTATLQQQRATNWLTWVIVALTLVLVGIAVVDMLWIS